MGKTYNLTTTNPPLTVQLFVFLDNSHREIALTTIFIAGSISITRLHPKVQKRIQNIVSSNFEVVVGDACGADTAIQECLLAYQTKSVTVYCSGESPRNNLGCWPVHAVQPSAKVGSRAYFTAKDIAMAHCCDFGLMIWDCVSTGTLSNIIELLKQKKKSVVFIDKKEEFLTISTIENLNTLISLMPSSAKQRAQEKIDLSAKIAELSFEQLPLSWTENLTGENSSSSWTSLIT